jgi:uncharacterized repeat protein (TIGR01451 family)
MRDITRTVRGATCASALHDDTPTANLLRCGTSLTWERMVALLLPVVVAVWSQYALAQDPVPVQTALIAEIRETFDVGDGRQMQRLVPASVIEQGEVVFYTVQIRNPTALPARDLAIVQRLPANTTYVPRSASGPSVDITFSVDGGRTFLREKELVVVTPEGTSRPAVAADYTHIRWQLHNVLAPGAMALARFQAVFR